MSTKTLNGNAIVSRLIILDLSVRSLAIRGTSAMHVADYSNEQIRSLDGARKNASGSESRAPNDSMSLQRIRVKPIKHLHYGFTKVPEISRDY